MKLNRPALIIGVYFILLALSHMAAMPIFEASDEAAHFLYVHNLLEDGTLPVIESRAAIAEQERLVKRWSLESHQPPLYYAIGAVLVSWTKHDDIENYLRPNPLIFIRGTVKDNANKWLHDPSSPAGDTHIAVFTLRLYSLVLSLTTLFLVYGSAKLAFRSERLALVSMFLVASIPTFVSIGGSVNNDNLVTMLYSAGGYWSLRLWRYGIKPHDVVIISLILAAASLTKITGLTLFAIVYFGLVVGVYRGYYPLRQALYVVGASLVMAALLAGWWYLRNLTLYGDPLAVAATGTLWGREFAVPTESGSITGEIGRIWRSFWMMMGHLHYPVWGPDWFYVYVTGLGVLGVVGLLVRTLTPPPSPLPSEAVDGEGEISNHLPAMVQGKPKLIKTQFSSPVYGGGQGGGLTVLFLLLVAALPVITLAIGTRSVDISYGRLLFPALTGFIPLMVWGWQRVLGRYAVILVLPLMVMALITPVHYLSENYPRLTVIDGVPVEAVPINVQTGDLNVLAYQLHTDTVAPGDEIRFSLYLTGQHPENPALYVTVLDPITGEALVTSAVYPGTAPTDSLQSQTVYHAPLRVQLEPSVTPLSPRQLKLQLGWQTALSTEYLPMSADALVLNGSTLIDPSYTVNSPAQNVEATFGDVIRLYGYDLAENSIQAGETLNLTLYWRLLRQVTGDWVVTTQILDEENQLVAQDDGDIVGYPTSAWRSGADVVDLRELVIPENTAPGRYRLLVGWYRLGDFARLPLVGGENDLFVFPVQIEVLPRGS